jgi:(2Fe-2S) ferredoxin
MEKPEHHIFVCSSSRINGQQKGACLNKNSIEVLSKFMEEIEDRELDGEVLLTNTGCHAVCEEGPIVIVYPEGVWYGKVKPDDVEEIMDSHIENGEIVERLAI